MSDQRDTKPPTTSAGDHVHSLVRGVAGMLPFAGSVAGEIFNTVVAPPLEARRDEWRVMIGERLQQLEVEKSGTLEQLQQDETFVTILLHASSAAVKNHQTEKREALHNAILNSASPNPPDESIQLMFVNWIDEFTVWHLRLLDFFQNPLAWFHLNSITPPAFVMVGSLKQALQVAYPELIEKGVLWELIMDELMAKGLLPKSNIHVVMSGDGVYQERKTDIGELFLAFIREPQSD